MVLNDSIERSPHTGHAEQLIADFDQGSCGSVFHPGVHFVNIDGKRMRIWYLGEDRYRVAGKTRVVLNPVSLVSEVPGREFSDTTFNIQ